MGLVLFPRPWYAMSLSCIGLWRRAHQALESPSLSQACPSSLNSIYNCSALLGMAVGTIISLDAALMAIKIPE